MPQYTTVTKVREAAGFVGNANITDAQISGQIDIASNMIDSKISDVYALPLTKFYRNTITFSGTGDGSGNMTITVNSVNYIVAITDTLTPSAAADLFRLAVMGETNATFQVDAVGSGVAVSMTTCNQDEDSADVKITSTDPQTVQGIVATGGTVVQVAPPMIENLATQIAAALLLIQDYGVESQDTDKEGFKRMAFWVGDEEAPGMLTMIQEKKMKVFDCSGTELASSSTQQIKFFPTEASRDDATDPTANKFTMNQQF